MSDFHVSVKWKSSTVFAGEDVDCIITFKNVARAPAVTRSPSPSLRLRNPTLKREQWKEGLPKRASQIVKNVGHKTLPLKSQSNSGTHKPEPSLTASKNGFSHSLAAVPLERLSHSPLPGSNKHRRSISIVSIGGDAIEEPTAPNQNLTLGRNVRGHARAASLQVLPRRTGLMSVLQSSGTMIGEKLLSC